MNTTTLIDSIRQAVLEFDSHPISDTAILYRLNEAYKQVYNHIVKSNDNMFSEPYYLQIMPDKTIYDLPKDLWGKRVEQFEVPSPPNITPAWAYVRVEKKDVKQIYQVASERTKMLYPMNWAQQGNKIIVQPLPLVGYMAKLLVSAGLVPLAKCQGTITSFRGDTITVSEVLSEELEETLTKTDQNFISICDFQTGALKACYPYSEINGNVITIGSHATRTMYQGRNITKCIEAIGTSTAILSGTVTLSGISDTSAFLAGDPIEIYDTSSALTTYSITGVITLVGANSISWFDSTATIGASSGMSIYKGSPTALSQVQLSSYITQNVGYDPINDIQIDDCISIGNTTSVSIAGDVYDDFLVNYAILKVRSSLYENDEESRNALSALVAQLKSDTAGRSVGLSITKDFGSQGGYTKFNRFGRGIT